jgi:[acyl-carrier-protein] S-malonyltransferase
MYEASASARKVFENADALIGFPISRVCFEGPEDLLRQTKNTQPAIFLHSMALTTLMNHGEITMAAGHSLGEYSALVFAGAMSFETGLKLVRLRGELMQQAGEEEQGTMAAVVGLDGAVIDEVCREAGSAGTVQAANFNSPGQVVISGSVAGVRKGMELAKARGAKMVKELVVSGAFHSPLMKKAHEGLIKGLANSEIRDARIPVYANVTGKPVQRAAEIRTLLEQQLTHAVQWEQSVRNMIAAGATTFVEIGPGKVLQGLVKRINNGVEVRGVDKFPDIQIPAQASG